MSYSLLDEDEYELHSKEMSYPDVIDKILKRNVDKLISWIQQKRGPFAPDFIDAWTSRYKFQLDMQADDC